MKTLGYLRVSTQDQNPDRQIDGLAEICDAHFVERASAASLKRPVFNDVLQQLQPGDTLVVWDLDRAFRSTIDAIQTADMLQQRGIALHIVNLQLDTRTPAGRLVYTVLSACAEFERRLISQRTKEGLAAAKRRGKRLGRPPKVSCLRLKQLSMEIEQGKITLKQAAQICDMTPWSLARAIRKSLD